ncbi:MAG: diguanylate cyclase [Deltaproteobacteria bacterium]|nr:MAG: diguanylate cyclase [Deltaproteobacteria bacterium]
MNRMIRKLGLKLVLSSLIVAVVTIVIGGYILYRVSEDSIMEDNLRAAAELTVRFEALQSVGKNSAKTAEDIITSVKVERFGSAWVMDSNGFLIAHMDPRMKSLVAEKTFIGDTVVHLQKIELPVHKLGEKNVVHEAKLLDLIDKFDGGFGTYSFLGETKIIAFKVMKERGWLVAVDQPISTAFSELKRIKKIIFTTSFVVGLLILGFTWFATQLIIRPFYAEVEEMNERMRLINRDLEESQKRLLKATTSLARLYDISIAMQYSGFLESHLPLVLGVAQERFEVDRILLFMPDEEGKFLRCRAAVGNVYEPEEKIRVPLSEEGGAVARAFSEKKVYYFPSGRPIPDDLKLKPPYDQIRALRSRAFAVFPLLAKEKVVGVIGVDNKLSRRDIPEETLKELEEFSYKLAALIDNTLHFQRIREQAEELENTDRLTGLFHLNYFLKHAGAVALEEARKGNPVTLTLINIENFKEYNELNGYQRGDFVLQKVAEFLRKLEVMGALVCRCYGATMAILFPGQTMEKAGFIFEKFESDFNEFSFYGEKKLSEGRLVIRKVTEEFDPSRGSFEEFFREVERELFNP